VTVDEIRARVATVAEKVDDNEVAHAREDELHQSVLRAIASGAENAAELAAEALKTLELDFERWFA
jgi:hypothetical protein